MVLRSEMEELLAAWRALAGTPSAEGWHTIPVAVGGPCPLLAGRRFPGNVEALLVGFDAIKVPPAERFPQGHGFLVSKADLGVDGGRVWIALSRQSAGSLDLFAMMTQDVVATLQELRAEDSDKLLQILLARIRAWQDFMSRGGDGLLGPEAEVGLFGELEILSDLVDAGLPASVATGAWQGPLDGIQDFALGTGAIEVKSTVSPSGFPAMIGSLEQLDDSLTRPIFIVGVRLALEVSGRTLSQQVEQLRNLLSAEPAALDILNRSLLHAGFLEAVAAHYTRRFVRVGARVLRILDDFPRLTRAHVAAQIRSVRYEVDLDIIATGEVRLADALRQLGMIQ